LLDFQNVSQIIHSCQGSCGPRVGVLRAGVGPQQLFNMITERANDRLFLALRSPFLGAKWGFQEKTPERDIQRARHGKDFSV